MKCDVSRSHHTRVTGGVKCEATPNRHRWCHSLIGAEHFVSSQRQNIRQAVNSEQRNPKNECAGARSPLRASLRYRSGRNRSYNPTLGTSQVAEMVTLN